MTRIYETNKPKCVSVSLCHSMYDGYFVVIKIFDFDFDFDKYVDTLLLYMDSII